MTPGSSYGRTTLGDVVAGRFHAGSYYYHVTFNIGCPAFKLDRNPGYGTLLDARITVPIQLERGGTH